MFREQIVTLLKDNVCWVTFTKKDNSTRTLRCTLVEKDLPEKKEGSNSREPNKDVIQVFDLDAKAWKSFRVDSLKSISTFEPEPVTPEVFDVEGVVNK